MKRQNQKAREPIRTIADYEDILLLNHPEPYGHPRMPAADRAAQFSPFAALTGYEEAVKETARVTDARKLREEDEEESLDWKLQLLEARLPQRPQIYAEYFVPDPRKSGGAFEQIEGRVWKISRSRRRIILEDGREIPIDELTGLSGELFDTDG